MAHRSRTRLTENDETPKYEVIIDVIQSCIIDLKQHIFIIIGQYYDGANYFQVPRDSFLDMYCVMERCLTHFVDLQDLTISDRCNEKGSHQWHSNLIAVFRDPSKPLYGVLGCVDVKSVLETWRQCRKHHSWFESSGPPKLRLPKRKSKMTARCDLIVRHLEKALRITRKVFTTKSHITGQERPL